MDRATEIAHRVIPSTGSEWPLSAHGRAVAIGHATNIIRAEMSDLHNRIATLEAQQDAAMRKLAAAMQEVSYGSFEQIVDIAASAAKGYCDMAREGRLP